jgi:hypothetical protein
MQTGFSIPLHSELTGSSLAPLGVPNKLHRDCRPSHPDMCSDAVKWRVHPAERDRVFTDRTIQYSLRLVF